MVVHWSVGGARLVWWRWQHQVTGLKACRSREGREWCMNSRGVRYGPVQLTALGRHAWCWCNRILDASRSGRSPHHRAWRIHEPCLRERERGRERERAEGWMWTTVIISWGLVHTDSPCLCIFIHSHFSFFFSLMLCKILSKCSPLVLSCGIILWHFHLKEQLKSMSV